MIPELRAVSPSSAELLADPWSPTVLFLSDGLDLAEQAARAATVLSESMDGLLRVAGARDGMERFARELERRGHPAAQRVERLLSPPTGWQLRTRTLALDSPIIMGILNLTEDSFSGDGVGNDVESAVRRADELRNAGASLIDVGAESARADRPVIAAEQEAAIVGGAVRSLVREGHVVSSDTYKGPVAAAALAEGAEVVNDISGLTIGTAAAEAAARAGAGYVLNYSYSPPKRRPDSPPVYKDVVSETLAWFEKRLAELAGVGMGLSHVAIDPGIAFGKSHDQDVQVLCRLGEFMTPGMPLLLAHSRKNFIASVDGSPVADRDLETHVVSAIAYSRGARIFRVHDVAGTQRALAIAAAISEGRPGDFAPSSESWPWRAGIEGPHAADPTPSWTAPPGQRW